MKHISDLFSRYQNLIKPPQSSVVKEFIAVCQEYTKLTVALEQCEYNVQTRTLFLKVPSVLKSELIRRKEPLLAEMKKRLGENNAPLQIL